MRYRKREKELRMSRLSIHRKLQIDLGTNEDI